MSKGRDAGEQRKPSLGEAGMEGPGGVTMTGRLGQVREGFREQATELRLHAEGPGPPVDL